MNRITELADFLRAHDDFALFGHVNPDGDAAGSCIALARALQKLGKRAFVFLPGGIPELYRVFPCSVEIVDGDRLPFAPQTALAVDVSEPNRMGAGQALFETCPHRAVLDHHATNPVFGEICVVDGEAAACGELAAGLIRELGVEMDAEMGQWLFIALCTDSGRFGYGSTRSETLEAAAACLRAGADVDGITQQLYRTRSEGRTRLMGLVLAGLEMNADKTMCWARLTDDMLRRANALREDNEGIVNYLLEIRGVKFACLAEERGSTQTKFSLRSKGDLNVAADVAAPLGGGGHACAAGVTLNLPMEEALQTVLKTAEAALKNQVEQE